MQFRLSWLVYDILVVLYRVFVVRTGLERLFLWALRATSRTLLYALYFATVFGCAVTLYALFYLVYIPTVSHVRPVYLHFG